MPDLDVRITSMYPPGVQGGIRAYASATIAGCFAVRGIKIVEGGKDGLFMSMPSRKTQDGYNWELMERHCPWHRHLPYRQHPLKIQGRTWSDLRGTENKNRKSMEEIK